MIYTDLILLLRESDTCEQIDRERENIAALFPSIWVMFDFDQKNHAHQYDLWAHCVHTVLNLPKDLDDPLLYLAALLHDIGKPECQVPGKRPDDPNVHYYGHPAHSMAIVRDRIIPQLAQSGGKLTDDEIRRLLYYVGYHDDRVSLRIRHLKRHLALASFEEFQNLMHLQVADAKAHILLPVIEERIRICGAWSGSYGREQYDALKKEKEYHEKPYKNKLSHT